MSTFTPRNKYFFRKYPRYIGVNPRVLSARETQILLDDSLNFADKKHRPLVVGKKTNFQAVVKVTICTV